MAEEAQVLGSECLFLNASVSRLNDLLNFKDHLVIPGSAITGRVAYEPEGGTWRVGERVEPSIHSRRRHTPKRNMMAEGVVPPAVCL